MTTYQVREYRQGEIAHTYARYKQKKRALDQAIRLNTNQLVDKVDILVREYGEYERAGEYREYIVPVVI